MSGAQAYQARLMEWLTRAVDEGWISETEIGVLEALETRGADRLFDGKAGRPLTIGLFGGTGVGKSSLLNRLIGETVAAVGLERPTSTEVTLYVHEQHPLKGLDELFPVERVRILTHRRDEYRDVLWIDMPDIDSVERANRELVLGWLPYIDWLIYVVSPERYRDDVGWRVLEKRGYRHHWLFVMNRRDTGTEEQLQDFRRLLGAEGFDESLVLATSCKAPQGDDFDRIVQTIEGAVAEQGLEKLQQVGEQARLADLEKECERYADLLGTSTRWREFIDRGTSAVTGTLARLDAYLRGEGALYASRLRDRPRRSGDWSAYPPLPPALLHDYVEDLGAGVVIAANGLPLDPIRERIRTVLDTLEDRVSVVFREAFVEGASRPGNAAQRTVAAALRKLVYALPLIVSLGIAYVVVTRYLRGLESGGPFLGLDFLANSLMVLGLSALVPYLAARLLRPSVRRSIIKRMNAGLGRLGSETSSEWSNAMQELQGRSRELLQALDEIRNDIEASRSGSPRF